ncbi:rho-associated protein kinase 1-like isoform X2 [Spea bombifrons]|uniref:rho-associated protein kinase 1-like isoform X2 n=1 Tax=Spea bombifrons TaxID=233779 RepID=UPI002349CE89|nr:rho-associated protein kinase 1-like isoform X2 [Spea bombifrons]
MKFADEIWSVTEEAVKANLMQDSTDQRVGAFPSQKNHRRKGSGSSDENTNTRRIKLQTSFPPIHLSLISNTKPLDKKHKDYASNLDVSRDVWGEKLNLPQVEMAAENKPKPIKSFLDKSKFSKDYGCSISSLSNLPSYPYDGQKDCRLVEKQSWLDLPVTKSALDRLTPEVTKLTECLSCKNERRIRNDYDKILLRSKREKEALQQKVRELEAELKKCEEISKTTKRAQGEATPAYQNGGTHHELFENKNKCPIIRWGEYRQLQERNKDKQEQVDCLIEVEELRAQLDKMRESEREKEQLFKSKEGKLAFDVEELKQQLHRTKEQEIMRLSALESEKENMRKQLENTNSELEKFKKRRSLLIAELRKEKDCCLMEIEKLNAYVEKVKAENVSLSDTITRLQQDLEKRPACSCVTSQVYSAGAEVLLISHRAPPESGYAEYKYHEICSCGRTVHHLSSSSNQSAMTQVDGDEIRVKEMYKQLKRERNLLLDVMLIMYARRWFVEEAVPHVRRALRKCDALPEDTG